MLCTSPFKLLLEKHPEVFAYLRYNQKETILVLCNFSEFSQSLENETLPNELNHATIMITNREYSSKNRTILEPYESTVYQWNQ
ncbi:alpha-glucosidase C-terminal domain-containing protein [Jeotgalibaca sp. MA1X17-3]|uniref:alpha-glucosidase C-terminal domain-containing protein n=1 Tax=Jeotgalibaca sp. MA1X17-3 TaxID=2908211 RepID=UPI001F2E7F35|nr:alpha-glucosidase C-terminal domain-containing protein [Jeotgalibaca sp. MA1X17-3]UJF16721.1 alpha-glucosidase C-terminal domain-containing protein [Jeotgalibaca sp. MA1X17-3]